MCSTMIVNDVIAMAKAEVERRVKESVSSGRRTSSSSMTSSDQAAALSMTLGDVVTLTPRQLGSIVRMVSSGTLTTSMGRALLRSVFASADPSEDVTTTAREMGMVRIKGTREVEEACREVLRDGEYREQRGQYGEGDRRRRGKIVKFFVGKVMKATRGMADVDVVEMVLGEILEEGGGGEIEDGNTD